MGAVPGRAGSGVTSRRVRAGGLALMVLGTAAMGGMLAGTLALPAAYEVPWDAPVGVVVTTGLLVVLSVTRLTPRIDAGEYSRRSGLVYAALTATVAGANITTIAIQSGQGREATLDLAVVPWFLLGLVLVFALAAVDGNRLAFLCGLLFAPLFVYYTGGVLLAAPTGLAAGVAALLVVFVGALATTADLVRAAVAASGTRGTARETPRVRP